MDTSRAIGSGLRALCEMLMKDPVIIPSLGQLTADMCADTASDRNFLLTALRALRGVFYLADDDTWQDFLDGKPPRDDNPVDLLSLQCMLSKSGTLRMCTQAVAHGAD